MATTRVSVYSDDILEGIVDIIGYCHCYKQPDFEIRRTSPDSDEWVILPKSFVACISIMLKRKWESKYEQHDTAAHNVPPQGSGLTHAGRGPHIDTDAFVAEVWKALLWEMPEILPLAGPDDYAHHLQFIIDADFGMSQDDVSNMAHERSGRSKYVKLFTRTEYQQRIAVFAVIVLHFIEKGVFDAGVPLPSLVTMQRIAADDSYHTFLCQQINTYATKKLPNEQSSVTQVPNVKSMHDISVTYSTCFILFNNIRPLAEIMLPMTKRAQKDMYRRAGKLPSDLLAYFQQLVRQVDTFMKERGDLSYYTMDSGHSYVQNIYNDSMQLVPYKLQSHLTTPLSSDISRFFWCRDFRVSM